MPLSFENGWYRPTVTLASNQFINNNGYTAVLQILNPGSLLNPNDFEGIFHVSNNLFTQSTSPLYIEDLVSDHIQVFIENNVFADNILFSYGKYTFSGNIIFGRLDISQSKYPIKIRQNSFVENLVKDGNADTIVHMGNMGIYGSADSLNIDHNYWGSSDPKIIGESLYDYATNYTSPRLITDPFLLKPLQETAPHIYQKYKIKMGPSGDKDSSGSNLKWLDPIDSGSILPIGDTFHLKSGLRMLKILTNRPISYQSLLVVFHYMDENKKIRDTLLPVDILPGDSSTRSFVIRFNKEEDMLFRNTEGYLTLSGLSGDNNEYVPTSRIGYSTFLIVARAKKILVESKIGQNGDSSLNKIKVPIISKSIYKNKFELGVMGAYAIYYGTLANKNIFKNDLNSLLGLQFNYSFKNHFTLSAAVSQTTLTGSDLRSGDSAKIARGMSFKTPLTDFTLSFNFDLSDNQVYSEKNNIKPSIGFGIDYIHFNPMGEYAGKWYSLQPLGTGGQTIPGSVTSPYKLNTFGAPISFQLRYYVSKQTILSLFAIYHLTFTNYLDDVGPDAYPAPSKLAAANPKNADPALYFANPTNRLVSPGMLRSGQADGPDSFFAFGLTLIHHF